MKNITLGKRGERAACRYLKKQGYRIVERNYKNPFGEVDIIAKKEDVLAFIEVKTRLTDTYGAPSEAVSYDRQNRYRQAVKYYFMGSDINLTVRFDIIEVFNGKINHMENAF